MFKNPVVLWGMICYTGGCLENFDCTQLGDGTGRRKQMKKETAVKRTRIACRLEE